MTTTIHTIDASGKALGRLSSEVAALLNGKDSVTFTKHQVKEVTVKVINASKVRITGKKMSDSVHKNFSGFPGGLKEETLSHVVSKKGYSELIKHAVHGMLPKNKLQEIRMKNLLIEE